MRFTFLGQAGYSFNPNPNPIARVQLQTYSRLLLEALNPELYFSFDERTIDRGTEKSTVRSRLTSVNGYFLNAPPYWTTEHGVYRVTGLRPT